jgi:hypothetical protein
MSASPVRLWSDEPSAVDLLAFGAVAETAVEAVLDDTLDPVALGVSGPWGSGKSTVLQLIATDLRARVKSEDDPQILVVKSDPWRYDPTTGAKATLISEVLSALQAELRRNGGTSKDAQNLIVKLAKRVNWVKALNVAAKASLALQLPSVDDLTSLINEAPAEDGGDRESRTLDDFRDEFAELMTDDALKHVKRVVVLVDDLDRCLPDTVIETLETMRLFLAVPKMSFVIAADEERVADALRSRYPRNDGPTSEEEPAKLYLHKIVQTTLGLPALSRFDTEAYLLLLQLENSDRPEINQEAYGEILRGCTELRTQAGSLDDLRPPAGADISAELTFAARLTPMLYEKLHGSPRRIKRFLNDLNVRASIARRRGIELELPIVAKLMILELLLPDEFARVLEWLARGELRERLADLERRAGRVRPEAASEADPADDASPDSDGAEATTAAPLKRAAEKPSRSEDDTFSDNFLRWAKLPPGLSEIDLNPYLHLAASFAGTPLIDAGLPERLRDVAAALLSSSRIEQKAVSDADLRALTETDALILIEHLGRMGRDRPTELTRAVAGILRIAGILPVTTNNAEQALRTLPVSDIRPPVILLFRGVPATKFAAVLTDWAARTKDQQVKNALGSLTRQGTS